MGATTERDARLPTGALIDGRYRVIEPVGDGGMGTVYEVHDTLTDRVVALKTMKRPGDHRRSEMFRAEFRSLARLTHPNIARVYDFSIDSGGRALFTMELVRGGSFIDATRDADTATRLDLVCQLCRALAFIHTRGLVHGDLKPSNVLVSDGVVKLLDFGLVSSGESGDDTPYGTPAYMAPELALPGRLRNHRTDLYSLGVVIGEVFADGVSLVPSWLDTLVRRLCAENPAQRHPTANAVIEYVNRMTGADHAFETATTRRSYITGPLVGRAPQLARISAAVDAVVSGSACRPLVLAGPSGSGKSRLLREARIAAQLGGTFWSAAACHPRTSELAPVSTWLRAAQRRAVAIGDDRVASLATDRLAQLEPVDDLDRTLDDIDDLIADVALVFRRLAVTSPVVLSLDDAQWMSAGTGRVLRRIVDPTQLPNRPKPLVVLAVNTEQGTEPVLPDAERIALPPLDRDAIATLIRGMLGLQHTPSPLVDLLTAESDGSPMFVEQFLHMLADEGTLQVDGLGWHVSDLPNAPTVPTAIRSVLQRRLERATASERELVALLAAIDRPTTPGRLQRLTGTDDIHEDLVALERRGVLRRQGRRSNRRYRLRHRRIGLAALAGREEEAIRALHLRIARDLERQSPGDLEALAEHFYRASQREPAHRYSVAAADRAAASYAFSTAESSYRRARDLTDEPSVRDRLTERIADMQYLRHDGDGSAATLSSLSAEDRVRRARIHRKIGTALTLDAPREGTREMWRAIELLGHRVPRGKVASTLAVVAGLFGHLVRTLVARPDPEISDEHRELCATYDRLVVAHWNWRQDRLILPWLRAIIEAERTGGTGMLFSCYSKGACMAASAGYLRLARFFRRRGAAVAAASDSERMKGVRFSYDGLVHYWSGELEEALDATGRSIELLDGTSAFFDLGFALFGRSLATVASGRLATAMEETREATERFACFRSHISWTFLSAHLGYVETLAGRPAGIRRIQGVLDSLDHGRQAYSVAYCSMELGRALAAVGRPEPARESLRLALELKNKHGMIAEMLSGIYPALTSVLAQLLDETTGQPRRALEKEARAVAAVGLRQCGRARPNHRPSMLLAEAERCIAVGRNGRAARMIGAVKRLAWLAPQTQGRLHLVTARLLRARGDVEAAEAALAEAGRRFEGCGHLAGLDRVEALDRVP